jgi:hypothetical protein
MPHGVDKNLTFDAGQKRDIDILFLASYIDYEKLRQEWQQVLPKIVSQVMDDAIALTFSDDKTSFIEAFNFAYRDRLGLKEEPKNMGQDFVLPLVLLERYVKGKERVDLVKSIKDAQITIFHGHNPNEPGWEKVLDEGCKNVTLLGPLDFEEGLDAMKRAKIMLNSSIKNKQGAHERVFYGFACGALSLTNENPFINQDFEDEENILFFHPQRLDEVNDKLCSYLADEDKRKEAAAQGRTIVMSGHTWDHRVRALISNVFQ